MDPEVHLKYDFELHPYRVALAVNDVYKAYDHVDTGILRKMLNNKAIRQYDEILKNYDVCNLSVGKTLIKRSRGLPQGAKGSPMLFNLYLNESISDQLERDYIYADNIVLQDSSASNLIKRENKIEENCKKNGLLFGGVWNHFNYTKTSLPDEGNKIPFKKLSTIPKSDHHTERILGYKIGVQNDCLFEDFNKINNEITYKTPSLPPYKAVTYFKQYIKPKFAFHYRDRGLPKNLIRTLLKKMSCIRNLPDEYLEINHVWTKGQSEYWSKFWSAYVMKRNGIISVPDDRRIRYHRWRVLCVLATRYYLSIYQIVKFILFGECHIIPLNLTDLLLKNNFKMLDLAWFGIVRDYNESKFRILLEMTIMNRLINKPTKHYSMKPLIN